MTPALSALGSVVVRLPAYVAAAQRPGGWRRLPSRVWRAFWCFYAVEAR